MSTTETEQTYGYSKDKDALVRRLHRSKARCAASSAWSRKTATASTFTQIAAVNTALESLAFKILDQHVRHCVAGALTSGDEADAREKTEELLEAVQRFARTR